MTRGPALVLASIAAAAHCWACVVVYADTNVGPTFRVKVQDRARPVVGLQVRVSGNVDLEFRSTTGKDGVALFSNVPPGSYFVDATHLAGSSMVSLKVSRNTQSNVTVPLEWPARKPIVTRALKGKISLTYPEDFELELQEGISGRKLRATMTSRGEFDFGSAAAGFYFVQVGALGLIPVVIDPAASSDRMDLEIGTSDCGLWYTDESACPHFLQVGQFAGRVSDITGAAISNARVLLLVEADGEPLENLRSDTAGNFLASSPRVGTYTLFVTSPGFSAFRGTLEIDPQAEHSRLNIQLGIGGTCSSATAR